MKAGAGMNRLFSWLGIAMFVAIVARVAWMHGQTWELSARRIPVSLLSPDGETYRNGDEIDPINRAMIRAGNQEQVMGWALVVLLALFVLWATEVWKYKQALELRAQRQASEAVLAMAKQFEREGRRADAQEAFEVYRRSLESQMALMRSRRSWKRELDKAFERLGATAE
jgi:hypothetical protein